MQYRGALQRSYGDQITVSIVVEGLRIWTSLPFCAWMLLSKVLNAKEFVSADQGWWFLDLAGSYLKPSVPHVQKRNATKGQRSRENRQSADRLATGKGPEGDTEWEKAISLINFGFARPNGSDLSRFKNALFAAKSRNVPITSHIPNTEKA